MTRPGTTPGRRRQAAIDPAEWLAEHEIERRVARGHGRQQAAQAIRQAQKCSGGALKQRIRR